MPNFQRRKTLEVRTSDDAQAKEINRVLTYAQLLVIRRRDLKKRANVLLECGVEFGTPVWNSRKYLVVYRSTTDGVRERQYIGSKREKTKPILDAIRRGKEYQQLLETIQEIEKGLKAMHDELDRVASNAENLVRDLAQEVGPYEIDGITSNSTKEKNLSRVVAESA